MGPNPDSTKENGNRWTFSKSARFPERETLVPRANNNGKNDMPPSKSDVSITPPISRRHNLLGMSTSNLTS